MAHLAVIMVNAVEGSGTSAAVKPREAEVEIDHKLAVAFSSTLENPNPVLVELARKAAALSCEHVNSFNLEGAGNTSFSKVVGRAPDGQMVEAFGGLCLPTRLRLGTERH